MISALPTTSPFKLSTRLVLFSVLATGIGQSMTFALLAPLGREVGLGEVQIGLIITCSSLAFTLTSPIWGRTSDRWGRKPVLLLGLFGYTFGCILFASVFFFGLKGLLGGLTLYLLAIGSRVLMASLMSAAPSAASAYIADTTSAEQRVAGMGRLGAARTLGAILGPAMCGLLAFLGLLAPLYVAAGITLCSTILIAVVLREPPQIAPRSTTLQKLKLFDKRYFPYILIGFLTFFAFSMTSQTIGFYFQDRFVLDGKATAQALGMGMMFSASMSFFSQAFLVGRLKLNPIRLMNLGLPVLMIGYAALLFAGSIAALAMFLGILGLGLGMVSPGFTAGASLSVSADEQGAVGGLISACPAAGFVLGPLVGTSLYQLDHRLPYVCACGLMLPLIVYAWRFGRIEQQTLR
ncbi:MFS transporter [Geopsychrobacter electrodiphilus]|uniref:MFS transporter n=1 Tax=Geopsychrobacter electrodiphilus TaxID=225196 RepID=UPI00037E1238|nr:MFS transporter [Geopsychrobacter electrodiphilus]